jgi:hypothetical protein
MSKEQWQPIETAPMDGTSVLTWAPCRAQYAVSYWDDEDKTWLSDWREKGHPQYVLATHWMPLPAAPNATEPPAETVEAKMERLFEAGYSVKNGRESRP